MLLTQIRVLKWTTKCNSQVFVFIAYESAKHPIYQNYKKKITDISSSQSNTSRYLSFR